MKILIIHWCRLLCNNDCDMTQYVSFEVYCTKTTKRVHLMSVSYANEKKTACTHVYIRLGN